MIAAMSRRPELLVLTGAYAAALACTEIANAQDAPAPYCTGIPAAEATGYVALPRGNVFCPLVADPKQPRTFVSVLRESDIFDTEIGAIGVADELGLLRWGGSSPGDGLQLSVVGAVFAQFDLGTTSFNLINTDFLVGLPLTVRHRGFSMSVRPYHQSSHLGDEFLLETDIERENLSFESVQVLLSQEIGPIRVYGGGERLFNREPSELEPQVAQGGIELMPSGTLEIGRASRIGFIAGVDVKTSEQQDWKPAWSARGGIEFGRPRDALSPARRAQLLFEFYEGPTPYGQFFRAGMRYMGIGVHITPP
jgi:hypothetical protein